MVAIETPNFEDFARSAIRIQRRLLARTRNFGRLSLGQKTVVAPGLDVFRGMRLRVGDYVGLGKDVCVLANVDIGSDSLISSSVAFIGDDHSFDYPNLLIRESSPNSPAKIVLEGDNLIGYGSIIIGPVTIGRGTVVGAGSIVTRDLPPMSVCAGQPAKVIRKRGKDSSVE